MFNKSTFFAALLVLLGFTLRFASAASDTSDTPPACVLACVNDQKQVYNYENVCKTDVATVAACLKQKCDSSMYDGAITSYKASCKEANFNVVIPTATPSSAKTTGSSSTQTGIYTSTSTSTSTSTPTTSSSSSNSSATDKPHNENSASTVYYNSMLALIAVFATAVAL